MKLAFGLVAVVWLLGDADAEYTVANLGDVPYQVSIWQMYESILDKKNKTIFTCAGALITNEWVLTTATCVENAENGNGIIRLGAGHLRSDNDSTVDFHDALEVHKHDDYDAFYGNDDIALIKVAPAFVESNAVKPVPVRTEPVALNTACTASGWWQYDFDNEEVLKVGNVRTVDKEENCWSFFLTPSVYKTLLCGGIPASEDGSCNAGDVGGPLVCGGQLTGLFYEEFPVCLQSTPGSLYLDLTFYYSWITAIMAGDTPPTTSTTTPPPTTTRPTTTTTIQTTTPEPANDVAALGDAPYHVSLWYQWDFGGNTHLTFTCSGTLINKDYVLTTARCANDASGSNDTMRLAAAHLSIKNVTDIVFHKMEQIIQHENYNQWSYDNNIALIKVSPPFEETDFIKALPIRQTPATLGSPCKISGWKEDLYETSEVLKINDVSFLDKDQCTFFWIDDKLDNSTLCAGIPSDQPGSLCNLGEEGSPLICDGFLTGMFSEDDTFCISSGPGVYIDVEYYSEWILAHLPDEGFETTTGHTVGTTIGGSPGRATSSAVASGSIVILALIATWFRSA